VPLRHPLAKVLRIITLAFFGAAASVNAAEEEVRWYDVEVLLFVQKSQDYRESEHWPVDYTLPDLEGARELVRVAEIDNARKTASQEQKPLAFRLLNEDERQLNADAARIERAPDMELLMHFAWRQPGLPEDKAIAIRLSDQMLTAEDRTDASAPAAAATSKASRPSAADVDPAAEETIPRLEGTLRLILSRYLHVEADLLYREPLEPSAAESRTGADMGLPASATAGNPPAAVVQEQDLFLLAEQAMQLQPQPQYRVYRMQQSRRMRSNELHYLDHPVFGMAVKVTPYELPEQQPAAETATSP
jgi:hypothetical protein